MAESYATVAQLVSFLGNAAPEDSERLLARASELLDEYVLRSFTVDDSTGLPTDALVAESLVTACCAQIEFWLRVGEEHDVEGTGGHQVSIGGLTTQLPSTLAPRALRALRNGGLMNDQLRRSTWTEFALSGNQ